MCSAYPKRGSMTDDSLEAFLVRHTDQLVARWVKVIRRENPILRDLPQQLVVDAMALFIEQVALSLSDDEVPWDSRIARSHGEHRQGIAVGLQGLIAEYGLFLQVVHRLIEEQGQALSAEQAMDLSQRVLAGAAASAHAYAEHEARERRRRDAERFAFLAHDLRNPMAVIRMAWSLLERRGDLPENETVRMIDRALGSMVDRLEESLAEMQARVDGLDDARRLCTMQTLVDGAVEEVRLDALGKTVDLIVEPSPTVWLEVDESLMRAAAINIMHNAIKHTPGGTTVRVWWEHVDDAASLHVADEGKGIDPETAEQIYEAFSVGADGAAGFGLGLAIVQRAVSAHQGSVHMENRPPPETGCVFTIILPAAEPDGQPT